MKSEVSKYRNGRKQMTKESDSVEKSFEKFLVELKKNKMTVKSQLKNQLKKNPSQLKTFGLIDVEHHP